MKQFRYVIGAVAFAWQNASDVSIAKMNVIAKRFNKFYGDNWHIEYR